MLTIDSLRKYGANVQEGLGRCLNNEAFYLRLVKMGVQDANFQKLDRALADRDLAVAFDAAHALKGILANLALTPLLEPVSEMTELLRVRSDVDYGPLLEKIQQGYEALRALCEG